MEGTDRADKDPFVHAIGTHHLSTFLDKVSTRATTDGTSTEEPASPLTLIKKVSSLRTFFEWAREERQATAVDPTVGLGKRGKALRKVAAKAKAHYKPFSNTQLERIFEWCAGSWRPDTHGQACR
jgi:site-specific recombinase XerD